MGLENRLNLIIAVNGYKSVKKEKKVSFTDVTALDALNKKVLLRIIDPLSNECIVFNDIKSMEESIERGNYDFGFLISKKFTDAAVDEMARYEIQYASDDHTVPFEVEKIYLSIVSWANNQCERKCGKVPLAVSDCLEKTTDGCKTRALADSAKCHFEQGSVGLLRNDLMMALASRK